MRSIEELLLAKAKHQQAIQEMREEDELFPHDQIYDLAIRGLEEAIMQIDRRIAQLRGV